MSHRRESAIELKTSGWKTDELSALTVEVVEEIVSYGRDVARVKASCWEAGECAFVVERLEKVVPRVGCTRSKIV